MKKLIYFLTVSTFILFTSLGCKKSDTDVSGCFGNRITVKSVTGVKGRISILDTKHPDLWCIISTQGIYNSEDPSYDSADIVIPCQLPEDFKKTGLLVTISGDLKDVGRDFKTDAYSVLYSNIYYSDLKELKIDESY